MHSTRYVLSFYTSLSTEDITPTMIPVFLSGPQKVGGYQREGSTHAEDQRAEDAGVEDAGDRSAGGSEETAAAAPETGGGEGGLQQGGHGHQTPLHRTGRQYCTRCSMLCIVHSSLHVLVMCTVDGRSEEEGDGALPAEEENSRVREQTQATKCNILSQPAKLLRICVCVCSRHCMRRCVQRETCAARASLSRETRSQR